MVKKFTRVDQYGCLVKVEIWSDDKTGRLVRIRRVYYFNNNQMKADCYWEEDPAIFERWIKEEKGHLMEILDVLNCGNERLAETVRLLKSKT